MITSETPAPSTPASASADLMATFPSSCAGRPAKDPLNAPTAVRVALTMTMSSFMGSLLLSADFASSIARQTPQCPYNGRRHRQQSPPRPPRSFRPFHLHAIKLSRVLRKEVAKGRETAYLPNCAALGGT